MMLCFYLMRALPNQKSSQVNEATTRVYALQNRAQPKPLRSDEPNPSTYFQRTIQQILKFCLANLQGRFPWRLLSKLAINSAKSRRLTRVSLTMPKKCFTDISSVFWSLSQREMVEICTPSRLESWVWDILARLRIKRSISPRLKKSGVMLAPFSSATPDHVVNRNP